ncbi:MAG: SDR family oxidoreductase [Candidatus Nealsonbacteria bacterium]|nr:SDR family oxidoreductase [Candidatus Nealsonbacteria bacterium]
MKILLTGSSGFIGSSLKNFLEKKRVQAISYDQKDNILNFKNLKSKMKGATGIVHLAAMSQPKSTFDNPLGCVNINIGGTANILEAARQAGCPWVIFISSREVFGQAKILPITEKTPRKPVSIYGITKFAGEELCRAYSESYGLKTRILRFTSVYGGQDDKLQRIIPKFIILAAKNDTLTIYGTGHEIFDFTHIDDILDGIWKCMQEVEKSQKLHDDFILSFGKPVYLKDLAKIIVKELKSKSKIKYITGPSYSTNKCYADPKKAKEVLSFNPKTNIKEGIKSVIGEFKEKKII